MAKRPVAISVALITAAATVVAALIAREKGCSQGPSQQQSQNVVVNFGSASAPTPTQTPLFRTMEMKPEDRTPQLRTFEMTPDDKTPKLRTFEMKPQERASGGIPRRRPPVAPETRDARPEPTAIPIVTYDYQGLKKVSQGNISYTTKGEEAQAYWRMWNLAKVDAVCHSMALRDFAESEMRRVPEWITPQVYAGIAYLRLGDTKTGDRLLASAQRRIGDNPDYIGILSMIEPTPTDHLSQSIRRMREVPLPAGSPRPTPCPNY